MTNMPAKSSAVVAGNATQTDKLDLSEVALLGTIIGPHGPQALLRMGSGRIRKVSAGDRLGLGFTRVLAIGNGQLRLASGGGVQTLTIPGS